MSDPYKPKPHNHGSHHSDSHHAYGPVPERGLLNLINQKLEKGISPEEIHAMLLRTGIDEHKIDHALAYAVRHDTSAHQREAEMNDFLPPLKKLSETQSDRPDKARSGIFAAPGSMAKVIVDQIGKKGLFSGRLRRKDFIIGFLFFVGLGFILANTVVAWLEYFAPNLFQALTDFVANDTRGIWFMALPFIFAPITLMLLSLIARRLHNLGMPGWIAFLYLFTFISPFEYGVKGHQFDIPLLGLQCALVILFIALLTKKGHPAPNKHGKLPASTGSIFEKVFGRE